MKNMLLILGFALFTIVSIAQQTIYTANDYPSFSDWTFLDSDGDGWNWEVDSEPSYEGLEFQGVLIKSFSLQPFNFEPLNPDNFAYSIPLNFHGYDNVSLSFKRLSTGVTSKHEEHYSVYAIRAESSSELEMALFTAIPFYSETIETGRTLEEKTVDLSVFDGMDSIYIIFRHYNCTDEFFMIIDDVIVEGDTNSASIESNNQVIKASIFPQPMNAKLMVELEEKIASVVLLDLNGKIVRQVNEVDAHKATINTENIKSGVYIIKIVSESGRLYSQKCVK